LPSQNDDLFGLRHAIFTAIKGYTLEQEKKEIAGKTDENQAHHA
jgi:hypothetical protein